MVDNNQHQEKPQDFELIELLFGKVDSSTSNAVDQLDQSFEARYQSLVDQIQSYLHSSEKPGFFPHRFLGSFSSVLDTKLNDKLGIKKLHFRFEGARTLKIVAETESKTRVFIFTEDIEAQYSKPSQARTKNFEFTKGEWKDVMGRDYTRLDARKLQIDVIKILKDKYELVKSKPKSDKDVKSKKLHLYLKNNALECKAKDVYGNTQTIQISRDELKGNYAFKNLFFNEIKQFLDGSNKGLSDDVRKELSRITSAKGYTLKSDGEDEKINIKVESKKKIVDQPIEPTVKFQEVTKKLDKSVYLESYIEKLVNSDARQGKENLEKILTYIKEVHTNLNLQGNVYGIKAREADQHGFVAGIFDNFRYRDNTKLYLEQFAGGGYADIVLLVRGPNRAVDSVPILIELKAGSKGQVTPSDALKQAEGYVKGFRPNKMRILTNAGNAIAVGLNLDFTESFKAEVKPIKQPSSPLMEEFIELVGKWANQSVYEEDFKREVKDLLSSEYHTFSANKETKDHYYFSRDILGQSILINKIGQGQSNIKKYIYSYNEYPLNWSQGTEYTLSKSPVMTLILVQGNEGQEKTAFIFHIRESNTKEFYADKKIPVLNIPEIGKVGNVVEIKMSLKKYETGLSFEDLFEIEQISKYKPRGADQQFTGSFLKIPNSDELKVKFDQAITSQHASDGEVSLQAYKALLTEVADTIYPIKDLITNEARLQAVLNGLLSSYSDLKLKETSVEQKDSGKTVIIPEFQVGAGGRVDMVIQGIGPSSQGTKEYTPIALEFKLIDKNLNQDQLKQEVDKLTKEQNMRYAKGAALKAITDSDKMFFMGVVVNVKAKDKNSLILTSDEFVPALVVHSSIDIAKRKHLEEIQEVIQRLKNIGIQGENLHTLESATAEKDYRYWLQQHDIADIARIKYGYGADTLFEIVGSPEHIVSQLQQFKNSVITGSERRPLTLIVNLDNNHWVTLVISHQNGQYNGYYVDSLGNNVPDSIHKVLQKAQITVHDVSVAQQKDGYNCGLWALENARDINAVLQESGSHNTLDEIRSRLQVQGRDEDYFVRMREDISNILSIDPQRISNLEVVLAETQQPKFDPNSCIGQGNRKKRSVNSCLFSKDDVEKFSKGKVDENNVDKIIIDSEKFLTYVKNSQDEAKNAQLVEFIGDKSIEGDRKYLLDKVIEDQGYERYVQNERVKNLHGDISQQASSATEGSKLKGKLMNAAGGIQLIRGIHGAIVSCKEGTATDCGLNLGGIAWSFASQPIEDAMVKIAPKVVASAGKQTKFAVRIIGVKFGGTIVKGVAGAITSVFDIVDIGMSANNLVGCKKRENSDNPCGEKEIRDNIASISFSTISFVSGIALTALSMPGIGIAVGVGLMVGYGIYSGVSNIVEYEKKYDTTHGENWSIFWRTLLFQPIPEDVQHLAARKEIVNSLTKGAWKTLNDSPDNVVAYAFGLGRISGNTLSPSGAKISMNKRDTAYTKGLSRVIPDYIEGASRICLPQVTDQDYEKGIKNSIQSAVYYCENAVVISRSNTNRANPTIVYDLGNVVDGKIIGSNQWNNNFLINKGNIEITGSNNVVIGGDNVVNKFVFLDTPSSSGKVFGGRNSTNVLDLSESKKDRNVNVAIQDNIASNSSGKLKVRINGRVLVNDDISGGPSSYYYVGRRNKVDGILCMGHSAHFARHEVIVDSGGVDNSEKDVVENCKKVIILPYTTVKGGKSNCTFYVETGGYKGRDLRSEITGGTGTIIFPEFDLLSDCDQIIYSTNSNTLSLKINFGQNNQFILDIKDYVEQSSNKPHFVLVDKNGSSIVPKIERADSSTIKINSFELHSEHSLDNFKDVENHYKKILNNNKDYKVLGVIRGKTQSQDSSVVPHMVFGSSGDDIINFDQGTMFARGGKGNDMYVIADDINNKEIKIDNHSDDEKADTLFIPEVEEDFSIQQCDLHLNYNNTNIQVKNYLQDRNYRHLIVMNKKGETFIPNIQSMSCSSSSSEKGKLVPFLQATQTQNMFLLPKDFQGDHVVIDSRLEDIKKYKDKDDLLLIRESGNTFMIRIEGFYTDRSKWKNISYSLWNNNDLIPSHGLLENVDNVMEYKDKLRNDYERIVKEYTEDFSDSTSIIHHNQKLEKNISTSIGQDEERIGVMVLKNITPDRIEVSGSGKDLIFCNKRSNHTINIKNWDNSESFRISTLEFDLGLKPITIRRLDRFSLSEMREIRNLIDKASENYQSRDKYTFKVENDFRCLISIHSLMKKPAYQCSGFFSLQDQIDFVKSACSREQIEEFENKMPSASQFMMLLEKLHNDLSLNGYDQNTIDKCSQVITSGFGVLNLWINKAVDEDKWDEVQTLLDRTANRSNADVEHKNKCSRNWTLLNYFVYNGNVDLGKDIFKLILEKRGDINALESCNGWAALHYAVHYGDFNMASFLANEGAEIDIKSKNGKTALYLAIEEAKKNKLDIVKFLVEKGADIEAKENDGKSPLYLITYSGDLDTIKLLFDMIKAKDNSSLKTIKEIDSLRRKIFNQQNIPSTVKNFVDSYVSDAVQTVAKELRDNVSIDGCTVITKFGDEIYNFNKELFKEIIKEFISVVYDRTLDSDGILECINSYNYTEEKIYSYIALLDEMKRNNHLSDNAVFKLAYSVKEIIESGEKYDLREVKNRLPGYVKNVVFPSKVCIRNVKYDKYLYPTDTNITPDRRVITVNSIKGTWEIEFENKEFYIKNTKSEYLYAADYKPRDDERRNVFTWIKGGRIKQGSWKIEPAEGDNCYIQNIYQREYLYGSYSLSSMAITTPTGVTILKTFPSSGVFTWIGGSKVTGSEWNFEDCSRLRRKRDAEELESLDSRPSQVVRGRENLNDTQILKLAARLQDNLLPKSHNDESIVHWYSRPGNQEMLSEMMFSVLASVKEVIYPDQSNSRLDLDSCSKNKNNASLCPPLIKNIYNTINAKKENVGIGKENVLEITSGYKKLDIENFPIREKIVNDDVNRKKSLLDLSRLVKQVDRDLGIKPIPMIAKDKNDLLIKLSISATGLQQDVITVRLKNALISNWYKKLQIIFDNAPVEIDNNLKLTPSMLISNNKITVVTPQNIEEGNKLIICRKIEGYTFLHHKYDLIMTNALSANVSAKELYIMYFKDFYKEPKMKTLSIRFIDKEILLNDKINKIYNSDSIDKLSHVNFTLGSQDRGTNIKANDFHDDKVLKLAYCIKEVIEKTNNKEEISSFERLKNKLPESVKNIVFSPTACIKNVRSNGYLYVSSNRFKYNHDRRVVSTQVGGRKNQQVFWKVDPSHGNSYIKNVKFNECLHPPVNKNVHSSEGRNVFTLIGEGEDQCNFWKFKPVGENVHIQDAKSGSYLYVPIHNSKHTNNGSNVGTTRTEDEKSLWRFENCVFTRNKRDIQQLESKMSLNSGLYVDVNITDKNYSSRKPLAIDLSNQPEIAASSGTRPSSRINDLFSWVKSSVGGLFYSGAALPGKLKKILTRDLSEGSIIINKKVEDETPKTVENIVGMHDEVLEKLNKMDIKKLQNLCKEFKIKWNPKVDIHQCIRNIALSLNSICDVEGGYAGDSCANSLVELIEQLYKLNDKTEQLKKINQDISNLYNQDSNIILLTYLIGWYRKIKLKDEREDIHDKIYKIAYEVLKEVEVCKTISTYAIPIDISEDDIYTLTLGKIITSKNVQKDQVVETLLCALENLTEIKLKEDNNEEESNRIKEFMKTHEDNIWATLNEVAEDIIRFSKGERMQKPQSTENQKASTAENQENTSRSIDKEEESFDSRVIRELQRIKKVLKSSVQNKSVIKSPLCNSIIKCIKESIELIKESYGQKKGNTLNLSKSGCIDETELSTTLEKDQSIKVLILGQNNIDDCKESLEELIRSRDIVTMQDCNEEQEVKGEFREFNGKEVLKDLRDIYKKCIKIYEIIQVDCWDSFKHSLSNKLPLSNRYNFKVAYKNLNIAVEVLKLLYDRDLCRTVIDIDENISLNEIISLQGKMKKELKEKQQQQPSQSATNQKDVAKEPHPTVEQKNTSKSTYDFVLPNRNNIEDNSNLIGPASRLNDVSVTGNITCRGISEKIG